jgi:hypothetical protein
MLYVTQHRIKDVVIDETGTIILVKAMTYFKIPINCSESIRQGGVHLSPSFGFSSFGFQVGSKAQQALLTTFLETNDLL